MKFFYIPRRLDKKKIQFSVKQIRLVIMNIFSLISVFHSETVAAPYQKIAFEFLCLGEVAVTSLVSGTVWKYTGQGFCSGTSEKRVKCWVFGRQTSSSENSSHWPLCERTHAASCKILGHHVVMDCSLTKGMT